MPVEIVNTANPRPLIGLGTDAMIHEAAGPELLKTRHTIGDIAVGHAAMTPALHLAVQNGCRSIAFPLISAGNYGFPKDNALQIAISTFSAVPTGESKVHLWQGRIKVPCELIN